MKAFSLPPVRTLTVAQFWLLAIAAGIVTIHLSLTDRIADVSFFSLSLVFWIAVASLIWQKRDSLNLDSSVFSTILGILLLAVVLLKSYSNPTTNFLGVFPFICSLGFGLVASGFKGLRQYWKELLILFFLGVPKVVLWPVIDISAITAQFATIIMWYSGFQVIRQGFNVILPGGGVNVNMGCSGLEGMFYLLGLAVLALVMYPVTGRKRYFVPIVAITLAFIVNVFRVAVMAFFANAQNQPALEYWHVGQGSLIFSLISVVLFGLFYLFLLRQEEIEEPDVVESEGLE